MMRAAAPGAYVERETPLHRLDARVKLALLLAVSATAFARGTVPVLGLASLLAVALVAASGMGAATAARALRPCAVVLAFALVANALVLDGSGEVALAGPVGLSPDGLVRGACAVVRVVLLVALALVVSATTTETELSDAVAWALSPLGRLRLPVADVATVLSVSLRFIPVCVAELDRIVAAQRARGARFDEGGVVTRVRRWGSVLVPLVVVLFSHADRLADAMRDRCYGGPCRTRLARPLRTADVCVLLLGCVACLGALLLG